MKILLNQTVFVIFTLGFETKGYARHLILWKGCELQRRLGTCAL